MSEAKFVGFKLTCPKCGKDTFFHMASNILTKLTVGKMTYKGYHIQPIRCSNNSCSWYPEIEWNGDIHFFRVV